ncbi:MAG: right-handed parallel beta-helix repeat-containing protein, partial [Myxococcota bacterium]|nr:right-handed parallel beta-helix repeat-containing protein [Myxococcota bacterium]
TEATSSIIVGDNHFLGPISGEGVFLGPISGEGVFRIENNIFATINGSAVSATEATSSIIVGDNHFLGPISGEGVFLGPISGEGVFRVSSNRFEQIGTDGLVVMESAQSGEITGNTFSGPIGGDAMNLVGNLETSTISLRNNSSTGAGGAGLIIAEGTATYAITANTIADSGGPGLCLIDLESPGSVRAENNTITDAVGIGVEVLRNSAEVELLANTITGTSVAEVGPIDRDAAMAYGVALFDSKATIIRNNRIQENESAGILADMTDWGIYFRRPDLSGDSNVVVRENTFGSNGGGRNLVLQNINPEAQLDADTDPDQPAAAELLPAVRSSRAFRCGNGRLDGTEECDSGVAGGTDDCSANCRLRRGTMLAGGNNFLCTVSFIGRVTCRGDNEYGAVDPGQRYTPEAFVRRNDLPSGVLQVAAGAKAGCVRTAGGQVSCWGGGQLGRNQRARNGQPAGLVQRFEGDELVSLTDVRDLAMGGDMACAVHNDGSIACWGEGSLGDGYPVEQEHTTAQRIVHGDQLIPSGETSAIEDARQVAVGADYACYLTATGTVKCWGQGERSQLGQPINGTLNHAIPVAPELVADIEFVRAGKAHACALKSVQGGMNQAICWGANDKRQANPTSPSRVTEPVVIEGLIGVKELALGNDHTCALLNSGRIKCWGGNGEGQVGIGDAGMTPVNTPTLVQAGEQQPFTGQSALFGFGQNNCSLGRNGTLSCWGAMFEASLPNVVTRLVR